MGTDIPKQFLLLGTEPVLVHTFRRFLQSGLFSSIVIVLPQEQMASWEKIRQQYLKAEEKFILAPGGRTRSESVLNGLKAIPNPKPDCIAAIHDGVRLFSYRLAIYRVIVEIDFVFQLPIAARTADVTSRNRGTVGAFNRRVKAEIVVTVDTRCQRHCAEKTHQNYN